MAEKIYQIGPFVLRSGIELPYAEIQAAMSHATLIVSNEYPHLPSSYDRSDGTVTTELGWWAVFNSKVSSFVSAQGEIILAPQEQGASMYPHAICAIRHFLMQQGVMLLHASATAQNGEATLWLGESGFGKSTAAAAEVIQRGATHLGDDIVPIHVDADGRVVTFQCDRYAHLSTPLSPKLAPLSKKLPQPTEVRRDGKGAYPLSPPDTAMYPIRHLIIPGFWGDGRGPVRVGSAQLGVLIRGVVNVKIMQRTLGPDLLERLAAMLRQTWEQDCLVLRGVGGQA